MSISVNYFRWDPAKIVGSVVQGAKVLAPAIVSSVLQAGSRDQRIGKIIVGLGLFWTGASLVQISGRSSRQAIRWGTAAAGIITASYGIYNIVSGIWDFTAPAASDLPLYTSRTENSHSLSPSENKDDSIAKCEERLEKAKQRFLQCSAAKQLWEDVEKKGSFTVKCTSSDTILDAMVLPGSREILISVNTKTPVPSLLFELNNLKESELAIKLSSRKCSMPEDLFVGLTERLEFVTTKETVNISEQCAQSGVWPERWNIFKILIPNTAKEESAILSDYLAVQEKTGHTQLYRSQWVDSCHPDRKKLEAARIH